MYKTVLVTGSSGFIAFHTIQLLLSKGYKVVGIDDHNDSTSVLMKEKRLELLEQNPNFTFIMGSIVDKNLLHKLFEEHKFFGLVNLAARAGVRSSVLNPEIYLQTNEQGFLNLLQCCKQYEVKHIVQASTSSLYDGEPLPFLETCASNRPLSPYAASKKGAEGHAYVFHYLYGMNISVMRFFTVYGPYGRSDMSVLRFLKWIYEDRPLKINGDGEQTRDFTYVEDIACAVLLGLENTKGFEILNVGNNSAYSLIQMVEIIENCLEKKSKKEFYPFDPSDTKHTHANIDKIYKQLNWKPLTPLPQGIEKTIDWFLANYSWVKNIEL